VPEVFVLVSVGGTCCVSGVYFASGDCSGLDFPPFDIFLQDVSPESDSGVQQLFPTVPSSDMGSTGFDLLLSVSLQGSSLEEGNSVHYPFWEAPDQNHVWMTRVHQGAFPLFSPLLVEHLSLLFVVA